MRRWAAALTVAIALTGCGADRHPARRSVFVNGARTHTAFVSRRDASGTTLLLPAGKRGQLDAPGLDVVVPARLSVGHEYRTASGAPPGYGSFGAAGVAKISHQASAEILVTGADGRSFALTWYDGCGVERGPINASAVDESLGVEVEHSPAVTLMKRPPVQGRDGTCAITAYAYTKRPAPGMRLEVISHGPPPPPGGQALTTS